MPAIAPVKSCNTTTCAFNNGGCTAFAITVDDTSACSTFITLDARGGLPTAEGRVGACQRLECAHNKDLLCTASGVSVVEGVCTSYEAR